MPNRQPTLPDALRRKLPPRRVRAILKMDRRCRYQAIRLAQNLCVLCGKEPLAGKRYGQSCLEKARLRMRKKLGVKTPRGDQWARVSRLPTK